MNGLLATGLLLTTATQLRTGALSLGPGEICLVIWLILASFREAIRREAPLTPGLSRLLIFWAVFGCAQCLGFLTAYVIADRHDTSTVVHDILAYSLAASVSCFMVAGPDARHRLRRTAWILLTLGAAALLVQVAAGWRLIHLPNIDPWFWDRFRGYSRNPNQLALFCAILAFVGLHLADTASRFSHWVVAVACSVLSICVGRLTKADTFTFSLAAGGTVFFAIKLYLWLTSPREKPTLRPAIALLAIVATPLVLMSLVPFAASATVDEHIALGLMKNGGKEAAQEADLRLQLWHEAIDRGLEAGALGLGPGPHLPIPWSVIAGRLTEPSLGVDKHPQVNGTPDFEAHNTPLDLFTQGGLLAVLDFAWLMATAFIFSWKARSAGLVTLLCGVFVFGLTDLIVRPPIFWFAMALSLVATDGIREDRSVEIDPALSGRARVRNIGQRSPYFSRNEIP